MPDKAPVIKKIQAAFGSNTYPGDDCLLGSREGSEPLDEVQPFFGRENWSEVPSNILDKHSGSLNFFSEAGLRFFLPAYLVADLKDALENAEPVFSLVHGFSSITVPHEIGGKTFLRKTGKSAFINPKRYGALTFEDYSRYRLSVFTREEADAIVSYLEIKRDNADLEIVRDQISSALEGFWLDRVNSAPSVKSIEVHLQEEEKYQAALLSGADRR